MVTGSAGVTGAGRDPLTATHVAVIGMQILMATHETGIFDLKSIQTLPSA
jgi:hypothetical protein